MSSKYKFHNPEGIYFVTWPVVRWIDVFTRSPNREILLESFRYCQKEKGLKIHARVIMTNHLHMIVSAAEGYLLENIMKDLKKYTSSQMIKAIRENHIESRKEWMLNAFEQGFVNKAEDYPCSSILNYENKKGLINIELIE